MFFSLLLCAFETHVRLLTAPIALNFGFLYNPGGRVLFMLLVGFMALAAGSTCVPAAASRALSSRALPRALARRSTRRGGDAEPPLFSRARFSPRFTSLPSSSSRWAYLTAALDFATAFVNAVMYFLSLIHI